MSDPTRSGFDLSPGKRALLDRLLREEGIRTAALPRIGRRAREGPMPVSFAQERLWFLDRLEPGRPIYNVPQAVRLRGPIREEVLERVFEEIRTRHEILRTTFAEVDGRPVQVIASAGRLDLRIVDLSDLPEAEREGEAMRLANEEARRPFDLARGPLVRVTLLRLASEDRILLWTLHHIVSDAWSARILIREVAALYDAFDRGEPSPLPELSIQYADFAAGQREWLQGEVLEAQLAYWRGRLAGVRDVLQLPSDRPRPPAPGFQGAHEGFSLPRGLARELRELGRREGATLFMVLLAAFKTLLHRWSGEEDIAVGTLIANRNRVEIEGLIGFFANTLVLRTSLSGDPSFRELLARVREVTLGAYAHQDLPFERLVEDLRPGRDPGRNPFFQVMFVHHNAPAGDAALEGVEFAPVVAETRTARFDLLVSVGEVGADLHGWIEYRTDLFEPATIARLIESWRELLEACAADPDERIGLLPAMTAGERRRVVVGWNDTTRPYARERCVHELFEAQAARSPDAVAVVCDGETLSYAVLDERAGHVAALLRAMGVGPDSVVGVATERSPGMIVAVLGALKAGGACLPLDPAYPKDRRLFMLEDAGASIVLAQRSLAPDLSAGAAAIVFVDEVARERTPPPAPASWRRPSPDNLAYVIYTSGSTGRPKGVGMPHRGLVNLVEWHDASPIRSARTLQFASLSFDVSFQEIFSTFRSGGTLVLVPETARLDLPALGRILEVERVQRAHLPNVVLERLAPELESRPGALEDLREIMVGGEQLRITPAIVALLRRLGRCRLENHYGPSETHVMTSHSLQGDPDSWPALPPIGRPIANARVLILDGRMQPVPIGVPGELYIGGDCLARGYVRRPDLTAERFLPDPLGGGIGARLYRSGDLCRWRADGAVEFLGRADQQVKIRGHRIEPAEIEIVLGRHPSVKEAALVAREDEAGEKRLVACVVPAPGEAPDLADLRRHLRDHLPESMIPATFVLLDAFPRTPSGKVDRKALPPPGAAGTEPSATFVAPRTPVEERLASIWAQCLELERVGVHDGFFDLGGHSLLATQVLSRVREAFQVEVPLRRFFEEPTIAALARIVGEGAAGAEPAPGAIRPAPRGRSLDALLEEDEGLSEDAVRARLRAAGGAGEPQ